MKAALVLFALVVGCSSCGAIQNGGTAIIDCTIADSAKISALIHDFETKLISGGGTWAAIESEAEAAGKTIGGCALAEFVQTYATAKGTQANVAANQQARAALEEFRAHVAAGATFRTGHGDL